MANNLPAKRYAKDLGVPVPNVEFCPTEYPRLLTWPAPYLPLQLENERHDEFYVVLSGKVVALDSMGFLVPAGLALDIEVLKAALEAVAVGGGTLDCTDANLTTLVRYDATDVANGVINSRGVAAALGEPVAYSMLKDDAAFLISYNEAVAASSTAVVVGIGSVFTQAVTVGDHLGVAPYSYLRTASDAMSRSGNPLHADVTSNKEARLPYDASQLRHLGWELQGNVTVRTNYCLVYPVVANRAAILVEGQAVAIAASMASFALGDRVTFNCNSDIVPHVAALTTSDYDSDADATITARINAAIEKFHKRTVGQVIRKNTRFPSSYLDKVQTRWDSSVPGFNAIDATAGSATAGYPGYMYTAGGSGVALGDITVSLFMR